MTGPNPIDIDRRTGKCFFHQKIGGAVYIAGQSRRNGAISR